MFCPNLTPQQIFQQGAFGGTYWRPIHSRITGKKYSNQHLEFPKSWWSGLTSNQLTSTKYNTNLNKYGVKVGTTLEFWEDKGWINSQDPYGWMQWYCRYKQGRRTSDDKRQIKRWLALAGPNGRFRKWLITQIVKSGKSWNDHSVSPKIRQTLLHWGYQLTKKDYLNELKNRNS